MANPFTTNLQRLRTQAWQNEFPNATAATYSAKERKWRHFCQLSEHDPATPPSQELVELFITWLSHTAKNGSPMARTSVKQYVGRIATAIGQQFPDTLNAFHSLPTARYLKLTLRRMPKAKQRARPIEMAHLERLRPAALELFPPAAAQAAIFIALLAFWACLRLCTIFGDPKTEASPMAWQNVSAHAGTLYVSVYRDKTILSPDEAHHLALAAIPARPELCPFRAFRMLEAEVAADHFQPRPTDSITAFGPNAGDRLAAADILRMLNTAVQRAPASTQLKSHFTKHSFRRGHVQACLQAAISLSDIMLFGNWRSAPAASNYAQGATHQSSLARSVFP